MLGAAESADDLLCVIKGPDIVERLLAKVRQGATGEVRWLGRFFERTSRTLAIQMARALKGSLRDPSNTTPAGLLTLLLVAARSCDVLFSECEIFIAAMAVLRLPSEQTAEWRQALLHWPAEEFRSLLRDLQRKPPRVNNELATSAWSASLFQRTDPVSAVVQQALLGLPAHQRREIVRAAIDRFPPGVQPDPAWFFDLLDGRPGTLDVRGWIEILAEASPGHGHSPALLELRNCFKNRARCWLSRVFAACVPIFETVSKRARWC